MKADAVPRCYVLKTQNGCGIPQPLTDPAHCSVLETRVPRHGSLRAVRGIYPDVVAAASVMQKAAVFAQIPLELAAFHAERRREAAI